MRPSWQENRWSNRFRRAARLPPCRDSWADCLCDHHEGVTDRKKSRAVAKLAARNEIKEQLR